LEFISQIFDFMSQIQAIVKNKQSYIEIVA